MPLILGRPFLATGRALIDVEIGQLMLRFHNEQVVFNIFEAMKHRAENHKCYRIDVVDVIVKDNSREPQPTQPMEKAIVNSIESCDHDEDIEVKECIKQLEVSKQEIEPVKIEKLHAENNKEAQTLSVEEEKNHELKELPSHLKYVFLSKDASKPPIISSTLTPLEEEKLMRVLRGNCHTPFFDLRSHFTCLLARNIFSCLFRKFFGRGMLKYLVFFIQGQISKITKIGFNLFNFLFFIVINFPQKRGK